MFRNSTHRSSSVRPRPHPQRSRPTPWLLVSVVAIGLMIPRIAAGSHIMELQIQTNKLITLVEQRLAEETICFDGEFELPTESGLYVLDHVEFPEDTHLERAGDGIQLVVPVDVFTKTSECLHDPDCGLHNYQPDTPLRLEFVFDITGEAIEDDEGVARPFMCIRTAGLRINDVPVPAGAAPGLQAALESVALNTCIPISLDALRDLLAGDPTIRMIGAGADATLGRIALRIQFVDPNNLGAPLDPSWSTFPDGIIMPSAPNSEWSLFISADLFSQTVVDRFGSDLAGKERVEVTSAPEALWTPLADAGGRVKVVLGADIDVEICSIGTDADITVAFSASAGSPNIVHADGTLDIDLDDGDVFVCTLAGGPGFPFLLNSVVTLLKAISIESLLLGSDSTLPDDCTQQGDEGFACNFPTDLPRISLSRWNLPFSPGGSMTTTTLFGVNQGPVLGGPMTTTPVPPYFPLSVDTSGFNYGVKGGCSSLKLGWSCGVRLEGTGRLCEPIQVLDDPYGVFEVNWHGAHPLGSNYIGFPGQDFEVIFPRPGSDIEAYSALSTPYPCKLFIRTSIGAQTFAIPGPDASTINPGESIVELSIAQANCLKEITFIPHRMNPLWLVDPPPFDLQAQVLFDEPDLQQKVMTTELLDASIFGIGPVGGPPNESGETFVSNTPMQLQVNVRSRFAAGAPRAKQSGAAQPRVPDEMQFTLTAPINVDLTGKMGDGGLQGEALLREAFSRILDADPDQLPDGVRSASFFVDIDPSQVTFNGPLEEVPAPEADLDPAPQNQPANGCGEGACGAGSGFGMPLLMFGAWFSKRRSRGRRRRGHGV